MDQYKGKVNQLDNHERNCDGWKTAKNGQHFLVGEGGEIQAGFGGKYNGKKLNEIKKINGKLSSLTHDPKDKVVTKTGLKKSEVKKLVLEYESLQDKMKKKYGKKATIQQLAPAERSRYAELAAKMNSIPMEYRNRKNPHRFDSKEMLSMALNDIFMLLTSDLDVDCFDNSIKRDCHRCDSIPIGNTSFDEQGFLHDTPIVTSTGIFE